MENLMGRPKKVDSFKGARKFGQANPLFGISKSKRLEKAETKATEAQKTRVIAYADAKNLTKRQAAVSAKISDLNVRQNAFKSDVKDRLQLAKDVHTSLKEAEKKHEALTLIYEAKKEKLSSLKPPMKLKEEDKVKIKENLKNLERNIKDLKDLEKEIGKAKLSDPSSNLIYKKIFSNVFEEVKNEFEISEGDLFSSIKSAEQEEMGKGDRISHFMGNLFSSSNKTENQNKIDSYLKPENDSDNMSRMRGNFNSYRK